MTTVTDNAKIKYIKRTERACVECAKTKIANWRITNYCVQSSLSLCSVFLHRSASYSAPVFPVPMTHELSRSFTTSIKYFHAFRTNVHVYVYIKEKRNTQKEALRLHLLLREHFALSPSIPTVIFYQETRWYNKESRDHIVRQHGKFAETFN